VGQVEARNFFCARWGEAGAEFRAAVSRSSSGVSDFAGFFEEPRIFEATAI